MSCFEYPVKRYSVVRPDRFRGAQPGPWCRAQRMVCLGRGMPTRPDIRCHHCIPERFRLIYENVM